MDEQHGSMRARPPGVAGAARAAEAGGAAADGHLTLSEAARLAPGRPSANCVWRWCREGVKAASGTRVRLKHVRFGSRIYTTRAWLEAFGLALAEADAAHFDRADAERAVVERTAAAERAPGRRGRRAQRPGDRGASEARRRHEQAERELEEAGL